MRRLDPRTLRRTGALLLAAVAAAGCRQAPPPSLRVEYAGCRSVLAGPVCLVAGDSELTLWIETDPDAAIEIAVNGVATGAAPEASTAVGRRFRVTAGLDRRRLTVTAAKQGAAASWQLALDAANEPAWRSEVSALMRSGELDRAAELATAALAAEPRAPGLPLRALARIAMLADDLDAAEDFFRRAIRAHRDNGGLSDEISDATALFYLLAYRRHDLAAARAVLEAMPEDREGPAESAHHRAYYRGLLAALAGDLRTALRSLETAAEVTRRLDLAALRLVAEQVLLRQLQNLGRRREAAALAERLRLDAERGDLHPCDRGELLNNLGWTALLALETGSAEGVEDPATTLVRALAAFEGGCPQLGHEQINVRINLALAHLHAGRLPEAASELEAIGRLGPIPELRMMLWKLECEARLALAGGRPQAALERYDEMAALAATSLSPAAELRAALGRGRVLVALGKTDAALAAFGEAERRLDEAVRRVPLTEGRELFLAQRQEGIGRYLDLLLRAGRGEEAFRVARRSRSRILRGVLREERLERLAPEEQRRWDEAVSAYYRDRDRLDDAAGGDWRLSRPRLERLEAERRTVHRDLLRQLDDALAMLDRRGPDPERLAPPPAGELLLLYHPLVSAWAGFAHDGERLAAERLACAGVELPPTELADCLLAPFADLVDGAAVVRVLPYGPLRGVDFHALPWKGEPLLAAAAVIYDLDLPAVRRPSPATDPAGALLIADAAGDLPAARGEADAVAAALDAAEAPWRTRRLTGDQARGQVVRSLLPRVSLLHYAGHAAYEGDGGWRSALRLAAGGRLTVADVLLLERAPRWVVLSGCETGRSSELAAAEAVGLAHAFVAAGSESVVATARPVADGDALRLSRSFYRRWQDGAPPSEALRQAQLELRAADPSADWAAFRLLEP